MLRSGFSKRFRCYPVYLMTIMFTMVLFAGIVTAANATIVSISLEKGYSRLVRLLASPDMFDLTYGYCYVDLTLNNNPKSENCVEAFARILAVSDGIGVIIREQDRTYLPQIVSDVWRLVSVRN